MSRYNRPERKDPRRRSLIGACIACAVVLAVLLVTAGVMTYTEANRVYPLVRAEAGLSQLDPDVFLTDPSQSATYDRGITQEQLSVPGVYEVVIRCGDRTYPSKVEVVDTVKPTGVTKAVASTGELPPPEDFLVSITDATAVTVTYKSTPDMTMEGTQTVILVLTDAGGNVTELNAQLTVTPEASRGTP